MQVGLSTLLGLPDPQGVSPDLLLILAVYVGLLAPARTVAWSMLAIGIIKMKFHDFSDFLKKISGLINNQIDLQPAAHCSPGVG